MLIMRKCPDITKPTTRFAGFHADGWDESRQGVLAFPLDDDPLAMPFSYQAGRIIDIADIAGIFAGQWYVWDVTGGEVIADGHGLYADPNDIMASVRLREVLVTVPANRHHRRPENDVEQLSYVLTLVPRRMISW